MKKSILYRVIVVLLTISLIPSTILSVNQTKAFIDYGSFDWINLLYLILSWLTVLFIFIVIFIFVIKLLGGSK